MAKCNNNQPIESEQSLQEIKSYLTAHLAAGASDPCAFESVMVGGIECGNTKSLKAKVDLLKCITQLCREQAESEVFCQNVSMGKKKHCCGSGRRRVVVVKAG